MDVKLISLYDLIRSENSMYTDSQKLIMSVLRLCADLSLINIEFSKTVSVSTICTTSFSFNHFRSIEKFVLNKIQTPVWAF